jgi:hypothetical protein
MKIRMNRTIYDGCITLAVKGLDVFLNSDNHLRNMALNLPSDVFRVDASDTLLHDYGVYYIDVKINIDKHKIKDIEVYGSSKMISYEPENLRRYTGNYDTLSWHIIELDESVTINTYYLFKDNNYFNLTDGIEHTIVLHDKLVWNKDKFCSRMSYKTICSYVDSNLRFVSGLDSEDTLEIEYYIDNSQVLGDKAKSKYVGNLIMLKILVDLCARQNVQIKLILSYNYKLFLDAYLREFAEFMSRDINCNFISDLVISCSSSVSPNNKEWWVQNMTLELLDSLFNSVSYEFI